MKRVFTLLLVFSLGLILIGSYALAEEQTDATGSPEGATPAPQATVPEVITIGIISNLYEPVVFTHSDHTGYADNCESCHHHSTAGTSVSCSKCHSPVPRARMTDKTRLGLKGAYHKQCMGCHREMGSGPLDCTDCHARKKAAHKEDKREESGSGESEK